MSQACKAVTLAEAVASDQACRSFVESSCRRRTSACSGERPHNALRRSVSVLSRKTEADLCHPIASCKNVVPRSGKMPPWRQTGCAQSRWLHPAQMMPQNQNEQRPLVKNEVLQAEKVVSSDSKRRNTGVRRLKWDVSFRGSACKQVSHLSALSTTCRGESAQTWNRCS